MGERREVILVVDDDPSNLKLLAETLQAEGYDVRRARSGESALRGASATPPDLVLLDVHMPELSGYETCRSFKANPVLASIPVLFSSSLSEPFDRALAFELGAVDYIVKPFQPLDVLARVRVHLRIRQLHAKLEHQKLALEEQREQQSRLFSMVAHDMRSPLTAVLGNLDLLSGEPRLSPAARDCIADAQQGLERVNELIADLLSVHRLEEGQLVPNLLEGIELCALVEEALAPLPKVQRARVSVSLGEVRVTCDPSLLRRVVANLVDNALFHGPGGTPVQITAGPAPAPGESRFAPRTTEAASADPPARAGSGWLLVRVDDAGKGVPAAMRDRVFDKFYSTKQAKGSVGLGLTFCKLAIEAHGGHIGVDVGRDGGASFWFRCPGAWFPETGQVPEVGPNR